MIEKIWTNIGMSFEKNIFIRFLAKPIHKDAHGRNGFENIDSEGRFGN